ncbi:MAG: hypothetical protein CVU97_05055 [Firmicutes bacterium HGW-Firmicutes-21]|nr:MAG: hypothetical protein CVU97_05055 [Firmicutes bacterium HGW-Firmicutes-21]
MNELIFFGELIFFLGAVLLCYKLFGKTGLYIFTVFGMILSSIQVLLFINIFGFEATGGNALYAATFLITDILNENYGKKQANRAVLLGFFTMLIWLGGTQITLLYIPNTADFISPALKDLFGLIPRITLASLLAYASSQLIDVQLYHIIWKKTGGGSKMLWLRNNGSTFISQLIDTAIFTTVAFYGAVETNVFISILLTTYLFKVIVAIGDTPFMYLARKIKPLNEQKEA